MSAPAIIRTITPYLVAWIISLPLTGPILDIVGITDADAVSALTKAIPVVLGAGLYAVVHWLETRVNPRFGVLLGSTRQPTYTPPAGQQPDTVPADAVPDVPNVVPADAGN